MQAVGIPPSTKPLNFRFTFWVSYMYPVRRGAILRKVNKRRIGWLLNSSIEGRLELAMTLPPVASRSTLTFRDKGKELNHLCTKNPFLIVRYKRLSTH